MTLKISAFNTPEHQPFNIGEGPGGILMIHGFGGSPAEMRHLAKKLGRQGWYTRGMLLPGFGPDIKNLDKVGLSDWIGSAKKEWIAVMERYRPNVILGYSMGAAIGIHLAESLSPDALILVAPYWHSPSILSLATSSLKHIIRRIRPFKFANLSDPRVRNYLQQLLPGTNLNDTRVQQLIRNELSIRLSTIDDVFKLGKVAYRDFQSVNSPTFIIQGKHDQVVTPENTRKLSQRIPKSLLSYLEIPADHELLTENSGVISEIHISITNYLDKQFID